MLEWEVMMSRADSDGGVLTIALSRVLHFDDCGEGAFGAVCAARFFIRAASED